MISQPLILSTAYLPPLEYWVAIMQHSEIFIEVHENYQKQSYRNRCQILGPNGVQDLNIPIAKSGMKRSPIQEVQIFDDDLWQKNHWKSIETAYNSSPFFLYYANYFENLFKQKAFSLFDFNMGIIKSIFEILELNQKLGYTSSFEKIYDEATDLRDLIHPKKKTSFYNQCAQNPYIQVFSQRHGFIPNLSILDLIFNLGPEAESYLLSFKSI
jgi:hypothetical protein